MNKRVDAVLEAASKLSAKEQLEVAQRIMNAAHPARSKADEAWARVAEERFAAYKRGEIETHDAEEVLEEMRAWAQARRAKQRTKR